MEVYPWIVTWWSTTFELCDPWTHYIYQLSHGIYATCRPTLTELLSSVRWGDLWEGSKFELLLYCVTRWKMVWVLGFGNTISYHTRGVEYRQTQHFWIWDADALYFSVFPKRLCDNEFIFKQIFSALCFAFFFEMSKNAQNFINISWKI